MAMKMSKKVNICKILYSNNDSSDNISVSIAYFSILKNDKW